MMNNIIGSTSGNQSSGCWRRRKKEQGQIRIVILMLISFLLGIGVTIAWFHFGSQPARENANQQSTASETGRESAAMQMAPPAPSTNTVRPYAQSHPPVNAAALDEVKQTVPNFASISLMDGEQILKDAMLKKFQQAARDTAAQVQQSEQRLSQAQSSGSPDELQAARKQLQQVQSQGAEKLQEIASQLQTDIAALQQLKETAKQ